MSAIENVAEVSPEAIKEQAWEGFVPGNWEKDIDVRDFIQKNYTPYEGDESFLADATDKTKYLWKYLDDNYLAVERKQRVYDVDTHTPADIDAFPAGYIDSPEIDNVIVGLQTDEPCKRAMMPNGGWRMVEQAIKEAGKEPDPAIKKIFTKYRKTHNDGVFGVYTKNIKVARHNKILTGLPDAYGRGRIIGDYRRVALYGVDALIKFKQRDKDAIPYRNDFSETEIEHWIRYREEHDEQIKALKKLINLGKEYGLDLARPAMNAREAVQWTYMGYLASIKSQDGAAMSFGRVSAFFDIYFERDLKEGKITETDAQEIIDNLVMKLRIVRFLRTKDYDSIFSGDPTGRHGRMQASATMAAPWSPRRRSVCSTRSRSSIWDRDPNRTSRFSGIRSCRKATSVSAPRSPLIPRPSSMNPTRRSATIGVTMRPLHAASPRCVWASKCSSSRLA